MPQPYHPKHPQNTPLLPPHTALHTPYTSPSTLPTDPKIRQNKHRDKPLKTYPLFQNCKLLTCINTKPPPQNELYSRIIFIPTHHQPSQHTTLQPTLHTTHKHPSQHPTTQPNTPPTNTPHNHPNTKNKNPTKHKKNPPAQTPAGPKTRTKNYPDKQHTAAKLLTTPTTHTTSSPNTEPLR